MFSWITPDQIIALGVFIVGILILNFCARIERQELARLRDPRERWAQIDGARDDEKRIRNIRGTLLTLLGAGLALYGFLVFLANIE